MKPAPPVTRTFTRRDLSRPGRAAREGTGVPCFPGSVDTTRAAPRVRDTRGDRRSSPARAEDARVGGSVHGRFDRQLSNPVLPFFLEFDPARRAPRANPVEPFFGE